VNGLQRIRNKLSKQTFIHGLAITIALVVAQLLLDALQNSFLLFMPPLGFAFFLFATYGILPIIMGVVNIIMLHRMYCCEGWQIGFWLNGLFLTLAFSTITILLQAITGLPFFAIAAVEILILPYPFGILGKFSNRAQKTVNPQQTPTT
jgi:ABC-type phosphate/phosphonate transport system permease subunit